MSSPQHIPPTVHQSLGAPTIPGLPPPTPVVGTLIVQGKFEFRSVSKPSIIIDISDLID